MPDQVGKDGWAASIDGAAADGRLVARFLGGDPSAFDEVVATHYGRVARLVHRLLGWSDDAEDVVQEVFVAAWRNLKRYRATGPLAAWLAVIAINKCRSHGRRRRWLSFIHNRPGGAASAAADTPVAPIERQEQVDRVHAAMRRLPEKLREVVVLRYLEDLPSAQVGQLLGISPNAVNVRLHRARAMLRGALADLVTEQE